MLFLLLEAVNPNYEFLTLSYILPVLEEIVQQILCD